jgi:hypothetical protein
MGHSDNMGGGQGQGHHAQPEQTEMQRKVRDIQNYRNEFSVFSVRRLHSSHELYTDIRNTKYIVSSFCCDLTPLLRKEGGINLY